MPRLSSRTYRVAVPSYKRPETLRDTTLKLLTTRNVGVDRITVFTHDHDPHLRTYRDLCSDVGVALQVESTHGINQQRRTIADHYPPGTPVVCCDDDITDFTRATDSKTLTPVTDLNQWLNLAFVETAAVDLNMWGTSPAVNPFYMRPGSRPSQGLKFLIATFWGFYSRPGHPAHATTVEVKEDYEMSLRGWWFDGGVLRFNDVAAKADHYTAPGGCQEYRDENVSEQATRRLMGDWPGLVRRNTKRSSGHAEVLLTPKKRHAGNPISAPLPGRH